MMHAYNLLKTIFQVTPSEIMLFTQMHTADQSLTLGTASQFHLLTELL